MTIQDSKYEIYVVGYFSLDYPSKTYYKRELELNNFNLTENIENADFILLEKNLETFDDAIFSKEYSDINCVEIAEDIGELLKLRDEYEMRAI